MEHKLDLIALLAYIDPAYLSYQEGEKVWQIILLTN